MAWNLPRHLKHVLIESNIDSLIDKRKGQKRRRNKIRETARHNQVHERGNSIYESESMNRKKLGDLDR